MSEVTNPELDAHVNRLVTYFESLSPDSLGQLAEVYTPDAYFKDPFNEVRGLDAVRGIFQHMFEALHQPRFVVTDTIAQGEQCFVAWNFEFFFKGVEKPALQTIRGGSHIKFTADGRVNFHRDYWDAAEELYEKLPWVGGLMRWLKKRTQQ